MESPVILPFPVPSLGAEPLKTMQIGEFSVRVLANPGPPSPTRQAAFDAWMDSVFGRILADSPQVIAA